MALAEARQQTMLYPIASNADAASSSSSSPTAMRREGTGIHGNTRVDGMDVDMDMDKATPQHQGQRQGQDHQDAPSAKKRKLSSNGQPSILPQQQPKTRPPALPPTDLQAVDTLTSKQRSHLIRAGFTTTAEVLFLPLQTLAERFKISSEEAGGYIRAITEHRARKWISPSINGSKAGGDSVAAQLGLLGHAASGNVSSGKIGDHVPVSTGRIRTGDEQLDALLGGGLQPGVLSEVAGEASSGKTALSLQLALRVQLPVDKGGLGGSCAYLCSEGAFPYKRLEGIARAQWAGDTECGHEENPEEVEHRVRAMTDNVHLMLCAEPETLLHAVRYQLPALVESLEATGAVDGSTSSTRRKPVRLIVVDSIAAPFRGSESAAAPPSLNSKTGATADAQEDGNNSAASGLGATARPSYTFAERNAHLHEIATCLHRLALRHGLCVLFVNQVADVFAADSRSEEDRLPRHPRDRRKRALGQDKALPPPHLPVAEYAHEDAGIPAEYRNFSSASRYFSGEDAGAQLQLGGGGSAKMAVFGLPWANLVQTRVMLSRTGRRRDQRTGFELPPHTEFENAEDGGDEDVFGQAASARPTSDPADAMERPWLEGPVIPRAGAIPVQTQEIRSASLVFSPFAERGSVEYILAPGGLRSIGEHVAAPRVRAELRQWEAGRDGLEQTKAGLEDDDDDEEALWEEFGEDDDVGEGGYAEEEGQEAAIPP